MPQLCKLTHKEGSFVESHIIPRSFYNIGSSPSLIISSGEDYPKRSPIGVYDPSLVVKEGEEYFKILDDYAYKALVEGRSKLKPLLVEGQPVGAETVVDYKLLKLFFLSLLWRASETDIEPFRHVKAGPHAEIIRQMILSNNPGTTDNYSVIVFRFKEKSLKGGTVLFPYKTKIDGVNFYKFFLCEYSVLIKVDQRQTPDPFHLMQLSPDKPLQIFDGPSLSDSSVGKFINKIIRKNEEKMPKWFLEAAKKKAR